MSAPGIDELAAAAARGGQGVQQPQMPPPRETTYPAILAASVEEADGVRILTLHSALPREVLHFIFATENATAVGKKLAAPSIEVATEVPS